MEDDVDKWFVCWIGASGHFCQNIVKLMGDSWDGSSNYFDVFEFFVVILFDYFAEVVVHLLVFGWCFVLGVLCEMRMVSSYDYKFCVMKFWLIFSLLYVCEVGIVIKKSCFFWWISMCLLLMILWFTLIYWR